MKLQYEESGQGNNVLLLHGNFASLNWWRDLLDNPPTGVRVIAPNMPGFAGTSTLGKYNRYTIEDYARAVKEFIYDMKLGDLRIVGHSLGGAVTMELLTVVPEIFHSAMLLDSCPPKGIRTPVSAYPFLNAVKYDRHSLEMMMHQAMPYREPDNFDQIVDDAKNMNHIAFVGNAIALEQWYLKVHSFERNVYVVGGEHDNLVNEDHLIDTASKFKYNRLFVIENSGHSPQIENPEEFRKIFSRFAHERRRR